MGVKKKTGKGRLDKYYYMAKDQGYRSRSAFKLVQLAKKYDFLSKSTVCIDLCGAPGGWAQVAQKQMPSKSLIICVDLMPIKAIYGVVGLQGDITTQKCRLALKKEMGGKQADCVLNDGAPNVGAAWAKDAFMQNELTLHACKLACEFLRPGGSFVTKVFRSSDYNSLLYVFQQLFNKVDATKPQASRDVSAEIFVLCTGFKAGKLDPRLFDPKWVFMEAQDEEDKKKSTGANLNDAVKYGMKKRRGGYDEGDEYRTISAHKFMQDPNSVHSVCNNNAIVFDEESEYLLKHELTDEEIKECCKDLKVLGKKDLGKIIKWRAKIRREQERAKNKEIKAAKKAGTNKSAKDAKDDEERSSASSDDDKDETLPALNAMLSKIAQEERRETKKAREKAKKEEWRKKMSLGGDFQTGEEPDLFQGGNKFAELLENEDVPFINSSDEEDEDSENEEVHAREAESDTERIAREEVEQILFFRANKEKSKESMQKDLKKKKETRRELKNKEWAEEMQDVRENVDRQAEIEYAKREALSSDSEDDDDDDDMLIDATTAGATTDAGEGEANGTTKSNNWKDESRAERWFSQGIFANVPTTEEEVEEEARKKKEEEEVEDGGCQADEDDSEADDDIEEMDEKDIVKLPLTDKQRRRKQRLKNKKNNERKKAKDDEDGEANEEDDKRPLEIVPTEVPADGCLATIPRETVTMEAPTDPREKAEIQALGSLMIKKKSRMDLLDGAYNRYVFEDPPNQLPEWFVEEESKFNKPELPVTKELMEQFNAKMREINARPIRKVAEAHARKKKRLVQRMEKLRKEAKVMSENPDMSSGAKARQMERLVRKAKREDKRGVKMMAIKKGGGGSNVTTKGGKPTKNTQTKVVDKRLKKDKRGLKKAEKKNKKKGKGKKNQKGGNAKKGGKKGAKGVKKTVAKKKRRGGKK